MIITAYCICVLCCGKHSTGLAANNKPPIAGITCAGPRSLPLGTVIHIKDIGKRTITDRTAKKYDGRIDLFMSSHSKAKAFGIRTNKVTILRLDRH